VKLPVIVIIVGDDGVEEYVYEGSFDVILVWVEVPSPQLIVKGVVIFLIGILIIVPFTIFIYSNNIYLFR
jgi:protein-L-isoaspartate O-methyltransferase